MRAKQRRHAGLVARLGGRFAGEAPRLTSTSGKRAPPRFCTRTRTWTWPPPLGRCLGSAQAAMTISSSTFLTATGSTGVAGEPGPWPNVWQEASIKASDETVSTHRARAKSIDSPGARQRPGAYPTIWRLECPPLPSYRRARPSD